MYTWQEQYVHYAQHYAIPMEIIEEEIAEYEETGLNARDVIPPDFEDGYYEPWGKDKGKWILYFEDGEEMWRKVE